MLPLKIKTEKVVSHGLRFRKIVEIQGEPAKDLPYRYLNGFPHCTLETIKEGKESGLVIATKNEEFVLMVDDLVPEFYFQKVLPQIQASGHRLHLINEKIAELKKTWIGTEDFEI